MSMLSKEIECQEHNISELFKLPRTVKRDSAIKKMKKELDKMRATKDY